MNKDYPSGTEFEITMRVKTDYLCMDEADVIRELHAWKDNLRENFAADMHICAGSVRSTLFKKGTVE